MLVNPAPTRWKQMYFNLETSLRLHGKTLIKVCAIELKIN